MKTHTDTFKNEIKKLGRELNSKITYTSGLQTIELGMEQINSISPHYEGTILKSAMKQLDIDSNVDIPIGTEINYQFGLKTGTEEDENEQLAPVYEWLDFGNYIVYSSEKQEDTRSYKIVAYDKMLYAMKDYENLSITYPITIRNYINTICTHLGLTFANVNDTFANYDRELTQEIYLDAEGDSLGYTFRDVFDELSQVTASTICINANDELEIRYLNDTGEPKNLNGGYSYTKTNARIDYVVNTDGTVVANGTASQRSYSMNSTEGRTYGLTLNPGTYTVSGGKSNTKYVEVVEIKQDDSISTIATDEGLSATFTINEQKFVFIRVTIARNQVLDNETFYLQLEKGSRATSFEPYGSGGTDTIDEEFLKDINVNFGEKFGPVNSIVLTRAGGGDSVYLQDDESILENGLCELKIEDNQIMNFNDRADYLPDILETLDGLEYYANDFSSTGLMYLELCDKYNISIDNNTYNCVMFNDEINIKEGLEELIHTDMPEETETEYKYASKDDRQINKAYIIAKKNEAEIQALASKVVDISKDISGVGSITLQNAYKGPLHRLEISGNIYHLFPSNNLTPANTIFPMDTVLIVDEEKYILDIDYLDYTSIEEHDTFIYEDGKCWIERANGTIDERKDIVIYVDRDSEISMEYFSNAIFKCVYLLDNQYTSSFASHVEVTSEINLKGDELEAKVSQVSDENGNVTGASIILAVNNDSSQASINADKISLEGKQINLTSDNITINSNNFSVDETGKITANAGEIAGFDLDYNRGFVREIYAPYNYTQEDLERIFNIYSGQITPTQEDYEKYDIDQNGIINVLDYIYAYWFVSQGITTTSPGKFVIDVPYERRLSGSKMGYVDGYGNFINGILYNGAVFNKIDIESKNDNEIINITPNYISLLENKENNGNSVSMFCNLIAMMDGSSQTISLNGSSGNITCVSLTQTSQEQNKKNFELYKESALKEIEKIDIYKYNLKNESDNSKKHLGFVIGNDYKYSQEVTNVDDNGVDNYAFTSLLCKAIQEQQEQIELLKNEINKLKGDV